MGTVDADKQATLQEGDVQAGEVTEYDGITYATIRVRCGKEPFCIPPLCMFVNGTLYLVLSCACGQRGSIAGASTEPGQYVL